MPVSIDELFNVGALDHAVSYHRADFHAQDDEDGKGTGRADRGANGVNELLIGVRKDHAFGWQPMIEYAPGNQLGFQRRADAIADRLRQEYELQEQEQEQERPPGARAPGRDGYASRPPAAATAPTGQAAALTPAPDFAPPAPVRQAMAPSAGPGVTRVGGATRTARLLTHSEA